MTGLRGALRVWVPLLVAGVLVVDAGAQTAMPDPPAVLFSATVGGQNPAAQSVAIKNSGAGTLSWRIAGPATPTAPWLSVSPQNDSTPGNLSFAVNIAGKAAGAYLTTVGVATSGPADSIRNVVVLLIVSDSMALRALRQYEAEYEVELRFTGYSGLLDGYPDCAVNPRGIDMLVGRVVGIEPPDPDEDVEYSGILNRVTSVDYCETKGKDGPGDDERVWCAASLSGSATMRVQIKVYSEAERGAYVQADSGSRLTSHSVSGNCDAPEMTEIRNDYPSGDSGGSPSGQPIEDVRSATKFFDGRFGRLRVGTFPHDPTSKSGGWTLRVLRKLN